MKDRIYNITVKSAEKLFNRFGVTKTAVSDIAKEAAVSRATIFNNFGSKDGLLKAVLDNREKKLCNDITIRIKKEDSTSGKIKAVLLERIKLLSSLKFISDKEIAPDSNREIDGFMNNLNRFFRKVMSGLLQDGNRNDAEVNSMVNSIFFMMKGIEQGLSEQFDLFSIKQIEKDLDYFLQITVSRRGGVSTL